MFGLRAVLDGYRQYDLLLVDCLSLFINNLLHRFLTRIPVGTLPGSETVWRWSSAWFPLVGALLGALLSLVWLGTLRAGEPVAACLVVTASLWITGAFHEDALADTADALGGASDREQISRILKDSRIGPTRRTSGRLVERARAGTEPSAGRARGRAARAAGHRPGLVVGTGHAAADRAPAARAVRFALTVYRRCQRPIHLLTSLAVLLIADSLPVGPMIVEGIYRP